MTDWDHPDYTCREDGFFHDYSRQLSSDNQQKIVEQCVKCGHIIEFQVVNGRIDNTRYVNSHALFFLQPDDPVYRKFYGRKKAVPRMHPLARASIGDKADYFGEELNRGMQEARRQTHFGTSLT